MEFHASLSPLAKHYDVFIVDLWGVIHDGSHLYPKVKECLEFLRKEGKKVFFLSNAPRRSHKVEEVLRQMGITDNLYDAIVTSGEVFYQLLAHPEESFFKPHGRSYIYIGLEKDRRILDDLHYEEERQPHNAHFVLLSHSYYDNQPLQELLPLLRTCAEHRLPLLCINPDKEVVRLSGEHVYCAGLLAEEYRLLGGEVIYFGKPHRAVYEACLKHIGGQIAKKRIVAIGDNCSTDIAGAHKTRIDSVLVAGGVLKRALASVPPENVQEELKHLLAQEVIKPDFIIPAFNW